MSFRFTDRLYATRRDMLDDIAETWLSAGGSNSADLQADLLADLTDEQFAVECVAGFSLDGRPPVDPWSEDAPENHMESHGYSQADLAAAFGRARARVAERLADSQDEDEAFDDAQRTATHYAQAPRSAIFTRSDSKSGAD